MIRFLLGRPLGAGKATGGRRLSSSSRSNISYGGEFNFFGGENAHLVVKILFIVVTICLYGGEFNFLGGDNAHLVVKIL